MTPVGLVLLFLTGVGPLLGWRKSTLTNMRDQLMWPVVTGAVVAVGALLAMGFRVLADRDCASRLCGFVMGTIVQEFWRGANVRKGATGSDFFTSLVGLVGRNKRRYGGYIVHVGAVMFFLGCAGQTYKQSKELLLKPGEQTTLGRFTVRHDALAISDDGQKQMVTASVTVFENGKEVNRLHPAKWFFHKHEAEPPTTEVAMRRMPGEDLYIVLANFDLASQTAQPADRHQSAGELDLARVRRAGVRDRHHASARTDVFIRAREAAGRRGDDRRRTAAGACCSAARRSAAQHTETSSIAPVLPRNEVEKRLGQRLVCLCGSCGKEPIGVCACDYAKGVRREIATLVDQGKNEDQILQHFIAEYGSQELLGAPFDQGFNRLAWLFPYLAGAGGVVAIGFAGGALVATQRQPPAPDTLASPDSELTERLDDELRNLD